MRAGIVLIMLLAAGIASAQLRIPALPLPPLPLQSGAQPLAQSESRDLESLRRANVQRLIRGNRKLLEADPDGEAIVRNAILGVGISDAALRVATQRGFGVLQQQAIAAMGAQLAILRVPAAMSTRKALGVLRDLDPGGVYDYDHLYQSSGEAQSLPPLLAAAPAVATLPRIGLIDSGVDGSHPLFTRSHLRHWGCNGLELPDLHGTAVASLLIAHRPAELFAADVYCQNAAGGAVDAIVAALGWMAEQRVAVINVSLVGPKNRALEVIVRALTEQGYLLVAAVGNDGPASPPLYPAAYPGVVGVTGVDAQHRVLIEALRGPQVMFAALGTDLQAADSRHGSFAVRGTSFAAPFVAAIAAQLLKVPDRAEADRALAELIGHALDLGPAGRDVTYGYGFLGPSEESAVLARIPSEGRGMSATHKEQDDEH